MKKILSIIIIINTLFINQLKADIKYEKFKSNIESLYINKTPKQWGEKIDGIISYIKTDDKVIALTLDACGSSLDGYDSKLINFLINQKIKTTLFISGRWIDKNLQTFKMLSKNNLFEIENHGMNHKPCSINGKSIYGIKGTSNINELIDEIELNALKIEKMTGKKPKFYRSGTAYYDEFSVEITKNLGYQIIGFSILGDAGATYSANKISEEILKSTSGSIIICHFNHPEKETFKGLKKSLLKLKQNGFTFIKIEEYIK